MLLPLDGPAVQSKQTIPASETLVKVGASVLTERKVITVQPLTGNVYLTFETGKDGFLLLKRGIYSFEASETQVVYIKAVAGTEDVIIAERA